MKGWVYIITTKSMPSLLKVGFSRKDPELRALELNNTGNPCSYKVEYDVLVVDPIEVEKDTHALLSPYHENKEWFKCSIEVAIKAIQESAKDKILWIDNQYHPIVTSEEKNNRYTLHDSIAVDKETGLVWLRFSFGQKWINAKIHGKRKSVIWQKTFDIIRSFNESGGYAGNNDWRLPKIDELKTLVLIKKGSAGYFIDTHVFPENNPTDYIADNTFWSASSGSFPRTCAITGEYAYTVDFLTGQTMAARYKYQKPSYPFRLVRGKML